MAHFLGQNQVVMAGQFQGREPPWKPFYAPYRLLIHGTAWLKTIFDHHDQPCKGFWPVLFDYRGKSTLSGVEASIGARNDAYKTLTSILSDAYTYYGVSSITIKKMAFVELENGDLYEITDYRVPSTHCTVKAGAEVLYLYAVYPGNHNLFSSNHRGVRLVDRKNPQPMDIASVAEVSYNSLSVLHFSWEWFIMLCCILNKDLNKQLFETMPFCWYMIF